MKKFFSILVLLAILGSIFSGTAFSQTNSATDKPVLNDIKKAAMHHVVVDRTLDKDSKWLNKKIKLSNPVELYDLTDNVVGYSINLSTDGQPSGFIIVANDFDEFPILVFSYAGQAFDGEEVKDKVPANKKIKNKKILYLGGSYFAAKYELEDNTDLTIDVNGKVLPNTSLIKPNLKKEFNQEAREYWEKIRKLPSVGGLDEQDPADGATNLDPNNWETGYTWIGSGWISNVPDLNQWVYDTVNGVDQYTGCSPTAGSNIMAYWSANGYPNLKPGTQQNIVMALRTAMGTTQNANGEGVTSPGYIDDGLQSYARAQGYNNATANNQTFAAFSYAKQQISGGYPFLQSYWAQGYYGDHTVTGAGYKEYFHDTWYGESSDGHQYVVVLDNWGTTPYVMYVKWGSWNSNAIATFRPS